MSDSLEGQVAIVTGAGRGIGRVIACTLAAKGGFVVAVSRTFVEIEETVQLIREEGGQSTAIEVDVGDHEMVCALVNQVLDVHGKIDILVNNAGIQSPIGPLVTNDWRAWQSNIGVNLFGTFNCCQAVLPTMMECRSGKIVNLSGGGATAPRPNFSAYSASKAAVVRLTETLAEEVREHNVQVYAVAPGAVNTRMLAEVLEAGTAAGSEFEAARARERAGGTSPDMAAALVAFLVSDASAALTGKLIAAPHDNWSEWDEEAIDKIASTAWLTLRRMDPYTLSSVVADGVESSLAANLQ